MIFRHLLNMRSHPTWVRGLKRVVYRPQREEQYVAPYVGAWIETGLFNAFQLRLLSHPTWVRGLKLTMLLGRRLSPLVAPYVGAWIETQSTHRSRV